MTITAMVAGALCGLGVFLVVRALQKASPSDAAGMAPIAAGKDRVTADITHRLGAAVRPGAAALGLDPSRRSAADLAITGRSPEHHVARAILAAAWLGALVLTLGATLATAGSGLPPQVLLGGLAVAVLAGPVIAETSLRAEAAARRHEMRQDLGAYSELVVLLLAAGSGVEGALTTAADAGDDWTWRRLREALRAARLTRRSVSDALCSLGRELQVTELEEVGGAVALASSSGTRLRESLAARAEALRARELARTQAEAASATERMTFPVVALAVGFLFILGYPALSKVLTGF